MSGTSMSAPMVAGIVALLLQDEPNLNPDQVKHRLMSTAAGASRWSGYDPARAGAGIVDAAAAISSTSNAAANTGVHASQLLWTGNDPITWGSVNWNSVNWNSVNWNSVNWNSVNWNSVNWNSTYWEP
jgi:serine protease AprX